MSEARKQRRPAPVIGFRRRTRIGGAPYLSATLAEELVLPAGATLDLRRYHGGDDAPEYVLVVVAPVQPWRPEPAERQRAAADRLDGTAVRSDPRTTGAAPW